MNSPVPERWARDLATPTTLVWLLAVNGLVFLAGLDFYAPTLPEVPTLLWPLYADSPTAVALATLSLSTLLPRLGGAPLSGPSNRALAYLHTFAFVWLVKYGLWTFLALTIRPEAYLLAPGAFVDYWAIVLVHLAFVAEAFLVPHCGGPTRSALVSALGVLLLNDAVDYAFGYHPPLRYDPGLALPAATVGLSVVSVGLAWRAFDPPGDGETG